MVLINFGDAKLFLSSTVSFYECVFIKDAYVRRSYVKNICNTSYGICKTSPSPNQLTVQIKTRPSVK